MDDFDSKPSRNKVVKEISLGGLPSANFQTPTILSPTSNEEQKKTKFNSPSNTMLSSE